MHRSSSPGLALRLRKRGTFEALKTRRCLSGAGFLHYMRICAEVPHVLDKDYISGRRRACHRKMLSEDHANNEVCSIRKQFHTGSEKPERLCLLGKQGWWVVSVAGLQTSWTGLFSYFQHSKYLWRRESDVISLN